MSDDSFLTRLPLPPHAHPPLYEVYRSRIARVTSIKKKERGKSSSLPFRDEKGIKTFSYEVVISISAREEENGKERERE